MGRDSSKSIGVRKRVVNLEPCCFENDIGLNREDGQGQVAKLVEGFFSGFLPSIFPNAVEYFSDVYDRRKDLRPLFLGIFKRGFGRSKR